MNLSNGGLEARARNTVTWRIMPLLYVLYIVAFVDRANLGYAGLEMTQSLGFSNEAFGFGSGVFFLGYILFEVPGGLIVEMWSAKKWFARIMFSWGLIASLMGFIQTATQFDLVRAFLGVAEAGFFPGVVVYLTHWYTSKDRAKALALFLVAAPMSQVIGAPLSGALMKIHWLGLPGWRWMFFIEGIPAVICGFVILGYMKDKPEDAKWLSDDEKRWLIQSLEAESLSDRHPTKTEGSILRGLSDRRVILLAASNALATAANYGIIFFLPKIIQRLAHLSTLQTTLLSSLPYLFAVPCVLWSSYRSDRSGNPKKYAMLGFLSFGLFLFISLAVEGSTPMALLFISLAVGSLNSAMPSFWALPTMIQKGRAGAASIGLINATAALGGFAGPFIFGILSSATDSYSWGLISLASGAIIASFVLATVQICPTLSQS